MGGIKRIQRITTNINEPVVHYTFYDNQMIYKHVINFDNTINPDKSIILVSGFVNLVYTGLGISTPSDMISVESILESSFTVAVLLIHDMAGTSANGYGCAGTIYSTVIEFC